MSGCSDPNFGHLGIWRSLLSKSFLTLMFAARFARSIAGRYVGRPWTRGAVRTVSFTPEQLEAIKTLHAEIKTWGAFTKASASIDVKRTTHVISTAFQHLSVFMKPTKGSRKRSPTDKKTASLATKVRKYPCVYCLRRLHTSHCNRSTKLSKPRWVI